MACIKAPTVTPPDLSVLLPDLAVDIHPPHAGLSVCCELSVTIPVSISGIASIPGVAAILAPVNAVILAAVDEINELLDSLQVDCPLA